MDARGLYTALVTPFDQNLQIDFAAFSRLLQTQKTVDGIVLLGTTGEAPTISTSEQEALIRQARKEVQMPLIVGTGSYSTEQTIEKSLLAEKLGADALLIVTPYYNKPTSEGIVQHFRAVASKTNLPIIVYNIQGRTGKNIDTPTLKRIAEIPSVVAVKEASGSIDQIAEVIDLFSRFRPDFSILSGDDALTLPLMALGGHGIISVVSNLVPNEMKALVVACQEGRFADARTYHFQLHKLFKAAFLETNPIPIKEALNLTGLFVGKYRLPLCEMVAENRERLQEVLKEMQLL